MNIEIYGLKIFEQVMLKGSFSAAAKALLVTQPTISQQIAKIESEIGQKLFERVGHDIIPTKAAHELYKLSNSVLDQMNEYAVKFQENFKEPSGIVHYAMPESCQWTPHFLEIMSQLKKLPNIKFKIDILPNAEITKGIIESKFDFGFITGERLNPELRFEKFSDENYGLFSSNKEFFIPFENKSHKDLKLIAYPGWELFFMTWAKDNRLWNKLKTKINEPAVCIGTLAGAIHAMQAGAGVAVIPSHCVAQAIKDKKLFELKIDNQVQASSPVYLAKRVSEKQPKRVELVIELLKTAKINFG